MEEITNKPICSFCKKPMKVFLMTEFPSYVGATLECEPCKIRYVGTLNLQNQMPTHKFDDSSPGNGCAQCGVGPGALVHNTSQPWFWR